MVPEGGQRLGLSGCSVNVRGSEPTGAVAGRVGKRGNGGWEGRQKGDGSHGKK